MAAHPITSLWGNRVATRSGRHGKCHLSRAETFTNVEEPKGPEVQPRTMRTTRTRRENRTVYFSRISHGSRLKSLRLSSLPFGPVGGSTKLPTVSESFAKISTAKPMIGSKHEWTRIKSARPQSRYCGGNDRNPKGKGTFTRISRIDANGLRLSRGWFGNVAANWPVLRRVLRRRDVCRHSLRLPPGLVPPPIDSGHRNEVIIHGPILAWGGPNLPNLENGKISHLLIIGRSRGKSDIYFCRDAAGILRGRG